MSAPILQPVAPPPRRGNIDPSLLNVSCPVAVVDVETTGIDPEIDRIVEVGIVWFGRGRVRTWSTLVNPGIQIPPTASAIHHITDDDVADAPSIDAVLPFLKRAFSGSIVAAHGASHDASFIASALSETIDPAHWLCTYRLARHLYPLAPAYGVQELRYWLGITPTTSHPPHRALGDAAMTFEILLHQMTDSPPAFTVNGVLELSAVQQLASSPLPVDYLPFGRFAGVPFCDVPTWYIRSALGLDPKRKGMKHLDVDSRTSLEAELELRARMRQIKDARHGDD